MADERVTEEQIEALAARLRGARSVVVLTGAGVSAESGIRTFRDTMEGLWKEFDPAKLATPEAFRENPELVTRWYDMRRVGCLGAEPNPGHLALAELERWVGERSELKTQSSNEEKRFVLLTQNVDRLHQRAGSVNVVELHGSIISVAVRGDGGAGGARAGGDEGVSAAQFVRGAAPA